MELLKNLADTLVSGPVLSLTLPSAVGYGLAGTARGGIATLANFAQEGEGAGRNRMGGRQNRLLGGFGLRRGHYDEDESQRNE